MENLLRQAVIALVLVISIGSPTKLGALEQPRLRFVQWNDTHVHSSNSDYRLANEKMDYLVSSLDAETHFPRPDFVIGIGDMITGEGEGIAKFTADLALLKTKLAKLKRPFYPVVGNHEVCQREGDPEFLAPYRAAFGTNRENYTFEAAGIRFIVLDNSGAPASNPTDVGQTRRDWLRRVLKASPDAPVILCCHIPLIPMRQEEVLKKSFHWGSPWAQDDRLLELVDAHSNRILAVLAGHLHLTGAVQRKGVHHIVVSGTASYPCDFAYYQVFANRIHVEIHSLPDKLLTPDTDNHGKACYLHTVDYTDDTHSTHENYLKGNRSERSFDILLKRNRQRTSKAEP